MNTIKKILTLFISAIMCFMILSGCKPGTDNPNDPEQPSDTDNIVVDADYNFITEGTTDYKIVVNASKDQNEAIAVSELNYFLNEACGVKLPVITDSEAVYSEDNKYIVIGRNKLFDMSGIQIDDDVFGMSAYKIYSVGKMVFLAGSATKYDNYGPIFAVYEFLEHMINYRYYIGNCYTLNRGSTVKMKIFDITTIPSFDSRQWETRGLTFITDYSNIRQRFAAQIIYGDSHSYDNQLLPHTTYQPLHPDWYNSAGTHLRLVNEDVQAAMVERIKEILRGNETIKVISMGPIDSNVSWSDEDAAVALQKYGVKTESGMQIVFVNKVAEEIDNWLAVEYPGRKVIFQSVAYFMYYDAPVDYDKTTGTYTEHSPHVIPRSNVQISVAPINLPNWNMPITDKLNEADRLNFNKWAYLCQKGQARGISFYNYGLNVRNYHVNFNNFGAYKANLLFGVENKFTKWYDLISMCANSAFMELKIYVHAQLMWNVNQDYNVLAQDFINAYYGDAAPYILEYYNLVVTNSLISHKELNMTGGIWGNLLQPSYYPLPMIYKMMGMMEKAETAIEPLRTSNPALYSEMLNRVRMQKFSVQYIACNLYFDAFTKKQRDVILDEMEETALKNNITFTEEKWPAIPDMMDKIQGWRYKNV